MTFKNSLKWQNFGKSGHSGLSELRELSNLYYRGEKATHSVTDLLTDWLASKRTKIWF